ncbi:TB2/DP1 protein [Aphelenchoides avenae]|nr:TB2/DP1 protein [Aphelenchus avenae]
MGTILSKKLCIIVRYESREFDATQMFGFLLDIATAVVGTIWPAWRTWKALKASNAAALKSCCRYWVTFTLCHNVESLASLLLIPYILPGYSIARFGFYFWLYNFGYENLYKHVLNPMIGSYDPSGERLLALAQEYGPIVLRNVTSYAVRQAVSLVSVRDGDVALMIHEHGPANAPALLQAPVVQVTDDDEASDLENQEPTQKRSRRASISKSRKPAAKKTAGGVAKKAPAKGGRRRKIVSTDGEEENEDIFVMDMPSTATGPQPPKVDDAASETSLSPPRRSARLRTLPSPRYSLDDTAVVE